MKWNPRTGEVRTLYNLFDVFDPVKDRGLCSDDGDLCGPPAGSGFHWPSRPSNEADWTHANSAARGTRQNFIMSVRHLSAVVSFHADGSGVDWVLSSEVNASGQLGTGALHFKYDSVGSAQHNQHCARQLADGNVLLFDNGDTRPPLDAPRFSRLAEFRLDREQGLASLVWEFRPRLNSTAHAYSFHAGSAARLGNGNTIGGFVCDNDMAGSDCSTMVYEVSPSGVELSRLRVPASSTQSYRALPLTSVSGERRVEVIS